MFRKFFSINLLLSAIFLVTTVFPAQLFSYEKAPYSPAYAPEEKIDESLGYKPVIYKKVRCPRCGMEFYYIPGKEGPHSHWVNYEVSKDTPPSPPVSKIELERERINGQDKDTENLLELLKDKNSIEDSKKHLSAEEKDKGIQKGGSFSVPGGFEQKQYELRQKLTCPYDGHSFFLEGDMIEDRKVMEKYFETEKESLAESNFSKSIPFGISRELKQFGYDLFEAPKEEEKGEKGTIITGGTGEALTALGLLKAAFIPEETSPKFSAQKGAGTAVVPVSPDYVIGPGDTLVINIWGSVQETFPIEVDREGKIMLPKAGPLYIWGSKLKEAEGRIKKMLDQYYTNFYMDLSMGKLRDIQIYVMGEVKKPGSYSISSQSTVFQALYEAGGPTKLGSLRKIKLTHLDGKKEEMDLYPFLLEGEMIRPTSIQSGDTIFVPTIGGVIAVAGNVKRPAIYETKGEIPLQDLLGFAGGIPPTGDLQRLQVERIQNNEKRVMVDIELKRSELGKFSLESINMQDGDLVIVSPVVRMKHDFVSVIGNVERPGDYALSKDMKVSDLLKRSKGFLPGTYLQRAEIARVTNDGTRQIMPVNLDSIILGAQEEDVYLDEWDILLVYSESDIKLPSFVDIDGAVNRPGRYELTPGMKVTDLIFKAGGLKPGQVIRGAELFHIMPGEQPVIRELGIRCLSDINIVVDKDILLRAGDALSIKSEPKLTERKIAMIKGEVRYPGAYSFVEGERLSSLIERAGGFTKEAFPEGPVFTRKSIREAQEKMRQRFIERENRTMLEEQQSLLLRRGSSVDSASVSESLRMRKEMLEYVSSVDIEGRMVIKLDEPSKLRGSKYDILLEDGDELRIMQTPSAITVMGSVNNPASIPFEAGKGIEYYIHKTGGLTKHADKAGVYVVRANGEAISKFMASKKIERGDTIVVPQEFKYWTPPGQLLRDTLEMLSRIAVGVGIIAALNN